VVIASSPSRSLRTRSAAEPAGARPGGSILRRTVGLQEAALPGPSRYPPISDYALISDCHSTALISREASIDWACMPRFDSGSTFGRLIDWRKGGFCQIVPQGGYESTRRYLDGTLVLETTFRTGGGEARLTDCLSMRKAGRDEPHRQILRVIEGVRGRMDLRIRIEPRFDYGEVRPWIRKQGVKTFSAIGGDDGLLISSDAELEQVGRHELEAVVVVQAGERVRLSLQYARPEEIDEDPPPTATPEQLDRRVDETVRWWRRWSGKGRLDGPDGPAAIRSAIVLKGLFHAPTGAMVAAATTSLPEAVGGARNWDYRFSWIRDSAFALRALGELGFEDEADAFRRFVERSAAGNEEDLQIVYGVGGERRLVESDLKELDGYRRSRPVRAGNDAYTQDQHDVYGELLDLSWRWHQRGQSPDDDYWRFLVDLVDAACRVWKKPDPGIWEIRGDREHFVHSKVMCWAAIDWGIKLARECHRTAPTRTWAKARDEIRRAVETKGYDRRRGVFVRSFGKKSMDAALLLIPNVGFVDWDDERMVRTADAVWEELGEDDLVWRYREGDGLEGEEGAFLACSFWLAECLARQGRPVEARRVFDRGVSTANDLGLFSEEFDPKRKTQLGNFPQALTHLSHIAAAVALTETSKPQP
jgi:GH15 family glucan-1,4-alpha-glucosidase